MNMEFDEDLLEDDDEQELENSSLFHIPASTLDARRMLERHLEIKRLREQLDDLEFDDNWIN